MEDLLALPERQRLALVMRELNGFGYEDICVSLGGDVGGHGEAGRVRGASCPVERAKGRELVCGRVRSALYEAGDRRVCRGRRIDAHLRSCADCAEFQQHTSQRMGRLGGACSGVTGLGALGLLKSLLGGGGGAGGGGGGGGLLRRHALGVALPWLRPLVSSPRSLPRCWLRVVPLRSHSRVATRRAHRPCEGPRPLSPSLRPRALGTSPRSFCLPAARHPRLG